MIFILVEVLLGEILKLKKINNNITSKHLKSALLSYYRFKKRMIVATEVCVNDGQADVVACSYDAKISIEIEVKITISDLKQEFKKKKTKHWYIENKIYSDYYNNSTNYFYFCIPDYLYEQAYSIIKEQNKKYGIIVFNTEFDIKKHLFEKQMNDLSPCLIFKNNAQKLNDTENSQVLEGIVKRLTTEICVFYKKELMQEINT